MLDNGDRFLSIKPGNFEENFIAGEELFIGIHQNDMHLFPVPSNLYDELSLT